MTFDAKSHTLPGLDGQPTAAMQALLAGTEEKVEGRYQELVERCCGQLSEEDFTLSAPMNHVMKSSIAFPPAWIFPWARATTLP